MKYHEPYKEFNSLIADFMGIKLGESLNYEYPINTPFLREHLIQEYGHMWGEVDHFNQENYGYEISPSGLDYHQCWNWLMPVVEKIASLGFLIYIRMDDSSNSVNVYNGYGVESKGTENTLILSTYVSVVKFILNYNKLKK